MINEANKILYLDDDKVYLRAFSINYGSKFKVYTAENRKVADEILSREEIKVVVSDQQMPDITGIEFIKEINEKFPDVICIITSGFADKDLLYRVVNELDLFGFVEKPWNLNELNYNLESAIEKYDSEKEKKEINKRLELALEKAQESDRLKLEFLGSISHEIRTPVNGIIGFSDLLLANNQLEHQSQEYLRIIMQSAKRLVSLVDDMITAARLHVGDMNVSTYDVFLNELLDDLHRKFLPEVNKKGAIDFIIKRRKGSRKIPITTDYEKLYNIFKQLISNAVKFTKKGAIEFGVYNEEEEILYVKDTGPGVADCDKEIVFEIFRQGTRNLQFKQVDGIGVGLSIVKGLVKLLDGEIWFESELGVGSCVYFKIPLEQKLINYPKDREE